MSGKKVALLIVLLLLGITAAKLLAQGKKKKPAVTVADATAKDPLAAYDSTRFHYFLFPQFYSYWPIDNNDTILKYECFDISGRSINMDTLYNIGDVQHISLVKSYTNYTETYIDAEGKPHPQQVIKTLYKYDRTGTDSWNAYDETNHFTTQLKELRDDITRTDTTTIIDSITGTRQITVRKYYKILELEKPDSATSDASILANGSQVTNSAENTKKSNVTIFTYTVPEFYYYLPKKNRDTTLEFKCYDYRDSLMPDVPDYDSVHYYSVFKSYTDSAHTYKDSNGDKKLLPVSSIVKRYDRLGTNRWMCIEYPKNNYLELTEYKNIIVNTDTVTIIDPINDKTTLKVFNHYKLVK